MTPALATGHVPTRLGTVRYVRAGAGRPLVLLHGNGHSWREFEQAFGELAETFDVVAWDMPGHGDSNDVAAGTGIKAYAGALGELIQALGLKQPAICGSSVGAFVAVAYAAAGGHVSALLLAELQFRTRDWWRERQPMVEQMFAEPIQSREAVQARFVREVDDELLAQWNRDRRRVGGEGLMGVMAAIRDFDLAEALTRIHAPCQLLFGDKGPAVDGAEALARALPVKALVTIVSKAGHFISLDQPNRLAAAVTLFLESAVQVGAP